MLFISLPVVIFGLIPFSSGQVPVSNCNGPYNNYNRCLRRAVPPAARTNPSFSVPDQATQNRIKKDVDNCFKRERCGSSPVSTVQEDNARRDCFKTAKRLVDRDLNKCVDGSRRVKGWNPADDYPKIDILDDWVSEYSRIRDAVRNPKLYCNDAKTRQAVQRCVNGVYNFNPAPPRGLPNYWCDEEAKCWYDFGGDCKQKWDDNLEPAVCQCSSSQRSAQQGVDAYNQCINRRLRQANNDPGANRIRDYVGSLCLKSNNHPCRSQRSRYEKSRG